MTEPGRRQMRLLRAAEEVRLQPLPDNHARIYAARQLVQATLPHREPQDVPPEWSRTNGNYTLSIRPGWRTDPKTGKRQCIGYPYQGRPLPSVYDQFRSRWPNRHAARLAARDYGRRSS